MTTLTLTPFRPSQVTIGGELRHRMELTANKMLHGIDIERIFVRHFRERKAEPEVPGGFAGYGMFLDAIVKAAVHGIGGDELRAFKSHRLAELIDTQTPDGAITIFDGKIGFWDNHEQAYLIQALVLDHRHFGATSSLAAAIRLGDFLIARQSPLQLGLETAMLMLAQESGEPRFLDYCRTALCIDAPLDDYDRKLTVNGIQHVYTYVARILAQLQHAQLAERPAPDEAHGLFRRVLSDFSSVSGTCSGGFHWGEIWDRTQTGLGRWGETCVSAYLLRCTAKMLEFDALPQLGDLYERIMYNALFGSQSEDGAKQRYFTPFNEPGVWYEHDTYCCPNNFRRIMFELPDAIYFRTPDGLAINLYHESALRDGELHVTQRTRYPEDGTVELTVETPQPLTLHLRIPQWCPVAELTVADETLQANAGSWHDVDLPAGATRLILRLAMPIQLIAGTMAQLGRVALRRGPLVYALSSTRNGLPQHQTDLVAIRNCQPPRLLAADGTIRLSCVIDNQTHPVRDLTFTRFCDETRDRTFFPLVEDHGAMPVVTDELYHPASLPL